MPQGADEFSDAGLKPFVIPGPSGDPGRVVPPQAHSLDTPNVPTAPEQEPEEGDDTKADPAEEKSKAEGQQTVENYAAKIQEHSEQLYETLSFRAKTEDGYLDALLSGDKLERKMAKKILERNAEHFGAATPEEYAVKRAKEEAGDDPVKQQLAEIKARQDIFDSKQKKDDWESFKRDNAVTGEFAKVADQVHSDHPDMPYGLAVAAAKGLTQGNVEVSRKEQVSGGTSVGAPPSQQVYTPKTAAGKAMMRKIDVKKTQQFAKEYLRS